jgi:nucleoside-diphosphate-sugar epimerase
MTESRVGVLGASSLVGSCLLEECADEKFEVIAFSRKSQNTPSGANINWRLPEKPAASADASNNVWNIPYWICAAPIWVLPEYFSLLEVCGARKVVAVSSTSRFSKQRSDDLEEQLISKRLAESEALLELWAKRHGVEWVILRPTLIYGRGRDKNIAEIARFIRRFGFFPLLGNARGLRQPIQAKDVATACMSALLAPQLPRHAYNISGADTLTYQAMVEQVFIAQNRRPRLLTVPLWAFTLALMLLRSLPRYRHWSVAMAQRMNQNLVFDHSEATHDFGFAPAGFALSEKDLSSSAKAL